METLEFTLSAPIKVSVGGDFTEVDTLNLNAPPAKEKTLPIRLRSGFMKAAMGMAELKKKQSSSDDDDDEDLGEAKKDDELTGPDIEALIFAADIDPEKYMTDFRKLMIAEGVCTVAGQKFIIGHWEQVTAEDAMKLMGEYLAHFFGHSWLPSKTTTPS